MDDDRRGRLVEHLQRVRSSEIVETERGAGEYERATVDR
jgi:hypothetical protein